MQQTNQVYEDMGKMIAIFFKIIESQVNYPQASVNIFIYF